MRLRIKYILDKMLEIKIPTLFNQKTKYQTTSGAVLTLVYGNVIFAILGIFIYDFLFQTSNTQRNPIFFISSDNRNITLPNTTALISYNSSLNFKEYSNLRNCTQDELTKYARISPPRDHTYISSCLDIVIDDCFTVDDTLFNMEFKRLSIVSSEIDVILFFSTYNSTTFQVDYYVRNLTFDHAYSAFIDISFKLINEIKDSAMFIQSFEQKVIASFFDFNFFIFDNTLYPIDEFLRIRVSKSNYEEILITRNKLNTIAANVLSYSNLIYLVIYLIVHLITDYFFMNTIHTKAIGSQGHLKISDYLRWKVYFLRSEEVSLQFDRICKYISYEKKLIKESSLEEIGGECSLLEK